MATNIGRVEFIVDLDGRRMNAQARALGRQLAAQGKQSGQDFGDEFETEFGKSLTNIGKQASWAMGRAGRLAGEDFADSIESALKRRQAGIQTTLAEALIDKKKLQEMVGGFDDVAEGMDHVDRELRSLTEDTSKYADSILEAGIAVEEKRKADADALLITERTQRMQAELNDEIDRLNSLSTDGNAIRQAANREGITYEQTITKMRSAMAGLNAEQAVSNIQLQRFSDNLERTQEALQRQDAAAAKAAADQAQRDSDRLDRLARQAEAEARGADASEAATNRRLQQFQKQNDRYEQLITQVDDFTATVERSDGKIGVAGEHHSAILQKMGQSWRRLDGTVKLVIVSIVAAADEVAVLGSALGAGIVALGGAVVGAGVGILGLVGLFSQLNDELDKLPVALRPAAREFQNLGKAFEDVGESIATAAVANLGDGFSQIESNVRDLIPSLGQVGGMLGTLIDDFGQSTKEGTNAFRQINQAIENAVPNFDALARTTGDFGVALLRGMNRAQPLVEDLLGWVDKLVQRFDDFTRSAGFDEWISNAQTTFGAFGGLLDAVGRALNDLVSPDAVARTEKFLDNVTAFIPSLTTLLDITGTFDLFGIAAESLVAFGEAAAPLAEPLLDLAEAASRVATILIDEFAAAFGGIANLVAPAVEEVANFLAALPESTIRGIATALVVLATAFGTLNAVIGIGVATKALQGLTTAAAGLGPASGLAARGIGGLVKGLGAAGLIGVGAGLLAKSLTDLAGASAKAAPGVEQIISAFSKTGGGVAEAFSNASAGADSFAESLELVAGSSFDAGMERFGESLGAVFGVQGQVTEARSGITALDEALAQMVAGGAMGKAEAKFEALKQQAKEQGVSVKDLTALFPAYAEAVAGAANASEDTADGFSAIATEAGITIRSIEDLADAISGFGDTQLTANEAQRDFAQSIDDLNASIAENGTAWGLATEAGRNNMSAIDEVAEASLRSAAAIKTNTGSQELANAEIAKGREQLILQLAQFGIVGEAAEAYADSVGLAANGNGELTEKERVAHASLVNQLEAFGLTAAEAEVYATKLEEIPGDVPSTISLLGVDAAKSGAKGVKDEIDKITNKTVTITVKTNQISNSGQPIYRQGDRLLEASGDIFTRRTNVTVGEAGPEAIVPLQRPLALVDPAVRALSAYAQGLTVPGSSNTAAPVSRSLTIAPGAITIQGTLAPETTATNVVNRIAQRLI